MSVALVTVSGTPQLLCQQSAPSTTISLAYPNNVTKGNLLCVINGSQGATDSTTAVAIADTLGNTWTPVWSSLQSPSGGTIPKFIMGWYCLTKASGANTVGCVITQSGTLGSNAIFIGEFSGFSGSATLDQKATGATGSGSTAMVALSFVNGLPNDALFVASVTNGSQGGNYTSSVNSPFTGLLPNTVTGGSGNFLVAYDAEATSGTYNFGGTWVAQPSTMQWAAGFTISAGAWSPELAHDDRMRNVDPLPNLPMRGIRGKVSEDSADGLQTVSNTVLP